MASFGVTVRYRASEADESRVRLFHGLFHHRSEAAVLDRLRELHRSAARIDVVEVRWRDPAAADAGSAPRPARKDGTAAPTVDRACWRGGSRLTRRRTPQPRRSVGT